MADTLAIEHLRVEAIPIVGHQEQRSCTRTARTPATRRFRPGAGPQELLEPSEHLGETPTMTPVHLRIREPGDVRLRELPSGPHELLEHGTRGRTDGTDLHDALLPVIHQRPKGSFPRSSPDLILRIHHGTYGFQIIEHDAPGERGDGESIQDDPLQREN
jgi:hypothetical protein